MARSPRAAKSESLREAEAMLDIAKALQSIQRAEKSDKANTPRVIGQSRDIQAEFMAGRNPVQRRQTADEDEPIFGMAYKEGVLLQPPWLPYTCYSLYEESDILGACARSYVDNIEREYDFEYVGLAENKDKPEVKAELRTLEDFFSQANEKQSWQQVRRQARLDQVVTANSYCEVLEDQDTFAPMLVYHVPCTWMRIAELDLEPTLTWVKLKRGGQIIDVPVYRRFRRFCRWMPSRTMQWFKEFGDPRIVNRKNGNYYKDTDGSFIYETDLKDPEKAARYASLGMDFSDKSTSIWWNADRFGGYAYGVPIWVGIIGAARGKYLADWCNYRVLDEGGIPPWLLLIYGKLAPGTREYLENLIKNWRNPRVYTEPGFVEIEPNLLSFNSSGGAKSGAEFVSMRDMRNEESMFSGYIKQCREQIAGVFRIHQILLGVTEGPGGTNYAALETVQNQVWGPIQAAEDERVNVEFIQGGFGIFNWRVRTRPAPIGDQEQQYKAVGMASRALGPTAKDLAGVVNRILGTQWEVPDHPLYTNMPAAEALAVMREGRVNYDPKTFLPTEIVAAPTKGGGGGEGGGNNSGVSPAAIPGSATKSDQEKHIEEQALADTLNLFHAMKRVETKVANYQPPEVGDEEFRQ